MHGLSNPTIAMVTLVGESTEYGEAIALTYILQPDRAPHVYVEKVTGLRPNMPPWKIEGMAGWEPA